MMDTSMVDAREKRKDDEESTMICAKKRAKKRATKKTSDEEVVHGILCVEEVLGTEQASGEADSGIAYLQQNGLAASLFDQVMGYNPFDYNIQ